MRDEQKVWGLSSSSLFCTSHFRWGKKSVARSVRNSGGDHHPPDDHNDDADGDGTRGAEKK